MADLLQDAIQLFDHLDAGLREALYPFFLQKAQADSVVTVLMILLPGIPVFIVAGWMFKRLMRGFSRRPGIIN
jgi:hypothetical protein